MKTENSIPGGRETMRKLEAHAAKERRREGRKVRKKPLSERVLELRKSGLTIPAIAKQVRHSPDAVNRIITAARAKER